MAADFVSLADLLRAPAASPLAPVTVSEAANDTASDGAMAHDAAVNGVAANGVAANDAAASVAAADDAGRDDVQNDSGADVACDVRDALRDARLFRARLADAFDDASARLLRELATSVLARELRLAPCDLAVLARGIAERAPVVRVRVAPADVARVRGVPVVADPRLVSGDAFVELSGGALDARLGVRLAMVLEAFA